MIIYGLSGFCSYSRANGSCSQADNKSTADCAYNCTSWSSHGTDRSASSRSRNQTNNTSSSSCRRGRSSRSRSYCPPITSKTSGSKTKGCSSTLSVIALIKVI